MIDYSIFNKRAIGSDAIAEEEIWDFFLSGFTKARRVTEIFENVRATEKHWMLFPQYQIPATDIPSGHPVYQPVVRDEDIFFQDLLSNRDLTSAKICVDVTAILRPHLLFLMRYLSEIGVSAVDVLYSEPAYYREKERTSFAGESVIDVRAVRGFEGSHEPSGNEILIIGAGYESHLISSLCLRKEQAKKILLVAFPSLKPEMYQESLLRINEAAESLGIDSGDHSNVHFVPAYDPFETANVLRDIVAKERADLGVDLNIYLSPLATKAQALGFFLFYECELHTGSSSILFPITSTQSPDTTEGISRVWRYTIELGTLRSWRSSIDPGRQRSNGQI